MLPPGDEDPWRGALFPTSREFHESLIAEFPLLRSHPVLGKWLYLPEDEERFEQVAAAVIRRIKANDPRLGILAQEKLKKKSRVRDKRSRR